MKPHPRIRKTVKWGGAALTVLLVGVWVGSGWFSVTWGAKRGDYVLVDSGQIYVRWLVSGPFPRPSPQSPSYFAAQMFEPSNWRASTHRFSFHWAAGGFSSKVAFGWVVGIWLPVSIVAVPTAFAWWLDRQARRRARQNLCPTCRYPRTGLAPQAVCPECGSPAPEANP